MKPLQSLLNQIEDVIHEIALAGGGAVGRNRAEQRLEELERLAREEVDFGTADGAHVLSQLNAAGNLYRRFGAAPSAIRLLKGAYHAAARPRVG